MADTLKLRGGNTSQNDGFTGADREVTIDTEKKTLVVHDGTNAGGTPLMREEGNSGSQVSSVKFATSGTDAISINSSQQVGIGVGSASAKLEVNGAQNGLQARFGGVGTGLGITCFQKTNNNAGVHFEAQDATHGELNFKTAGQNALRIDSSQRIGIGTTNPSEKLHVNGNIKATGNITVSNTAPSISLTDTDNSVDYTLQTQGGQFVVAKDGATRFAINTDNHVDINGNLEVGGTVTCTSLTETSDIALKENIQPLSNTLEKLKQLTAYKYNFKSTETASMGVIAQDVEKIYPELVHGKEGTKSLQYSGLIGALIEAIKELSAKVEALEAA